VRENQGKRFWSRQKKSNKIKEVSGEIIQFFFSKERASQLFTFAGGGELSLMQ